MGLLVSAQCFLYCLEQAMEMVFTLVRPWILYLSAVDSLIQILFIQKEGGGASSSLVEFVQRKRKRKRKEREDQNSPI